MAKTHIDDEFTKNNAEFLRLLKSGPITEFAEYMGGDLEMAVQLRIDQAVEDTYDKIAERRGVIAQDIYKKWAAEQDKTAMEVTVRPIVPQGNLYGFANVKIGGITVSDFKIVENKDGELFVGMPSKPDKTSETGYRNTVFVDKDFREDFTAAVLEKYHEMVEQAKDRSANLRSTPDKPSIARQVAKAEKEAERHNASKPPKEKATKKLEAGRE